MSEDSTVVRDYLSVSKFLVLRLLCPSIAVDFAEGSGIQLVLNVPQHVYSLEKPRTGKWLVLVGSLARECG